MVKKITVWSYLEPLIGNLEFMHLAEISRKMNKNHSTVRKYLNFLEKCGVLEKTIKGKLAMYRLKTSFPLIIDYLVLAEKEKLVNKCRADHLLNEFINFLHNNLGEDNKAIIFGSSVTDSRKAGDIDLLITGKIAIGREIPEFEKKFNVKIHLINVKNLKSVTERLRKEIMAKHIIIQGSEEIIRWLI